MLKSYDELRKIDVKPYCEKRDGLLYLNWAMCIDLLRKMERQKCTGSQFQTKRQAVALGCLILFLQIQKGIQTAVTRHASE